MAGSKSYRELTCPDLVTWFSALHPSSYVMKGRDAHLLRKFIDDRGISSSQVLEGMIFEEECKTIPGLIATADRWLMEDALGQEAELAVFLSGESPPPFYHDYNDLKDTGVPSAQMEARWQEAKNQLEKFVDDALNATPTQHDRGRLTRRYRAEHGAPTFGQ